MADATALLKKNLTFGEPKYLIVMHEGATLSMLISRFSHLLNK